MGIIKHRCIYENETTSGYVMCTLSSDYGHYGTQTCHSVPLHLCEKWKQRASKDAERIWKEQSNE